MNFAEPRLLWLLLLAPAAAALAAWLWKRRLAADAAWASRGLWDRLLPTYARGRIAFSIATLALALLGLSLALARPRWGGGEQTVERKGVDVVFLVDSSLSMGAQDVKPSRLFVGKALIRRMAQGMPGNRVGLVQMEGTGMVLSPLTLDGAVLDLLLDTVDPGSLPTPGTEIAPGLDAAIRLFGEGSEKHRVLVMVSDGEDHGGGIDAEIKALKEAGVVVYSLGVGTPKGAPVPIPGTPGAFKRGRDGSVVVSELHEDVLEEVARASGGSYLRVTSAAVDPSPILRQIDGMEKRTIESQTLSTLEERFQWPLALAVGALFLHLAVAPFAAARASKKGLQGLQGLQGQRRAAVARVSALPLLLFAGWAALPLPSWLPQPHLPAWAERWLYNPRERTERAIDAWEAGTPEEAVAPAETALRLAPGDPRVQYNAGTANLAAGSGRERKATKLLEVAAREAGPELAPKAFYNLGNARLATKDASGAVEAYKQALRLNPGDADAKWNLELALKEQQKQKMGGQGKPQGNRGKNPQKQDESSGTNGQGRPDDQKQDDGARDPGQQQQGGQQQGQGQEDPSQNPSERQDGRLPGYRNQPEMSAREAASVLSAVENLERQQRRNEAAKRARQQAAQGKDW
ncbi:MAG TPA: VWA domain-containing protein [Thermoanaerobaculia bacterium]|nr:VWA domain-containing protein [Thermoanaerobaculia bacterium]